MSWSPRSGEPESGSGSGSGWDLRRDFAALDGRRGDGILSKSMSDVRATGRIDDRDVFLGETCGRALDKLCIGPVIFHRLLERKRIRSH